MVVEEDVAARINENRRLQQQSGEVHDDSNDISNAGSCHFNADSSQVQELLDSERSKADHLQNELSALYEGLAAYPNAVQERSVGGALPGEMLSHIVGYIDAEKARKGVPEKPSGGPASQGVLDALSKQRGQLDPRDPALLIRV